MLDLNAKRSADGLRDADRLGKGCYRFAQTVVGHAQLAQCGIGVCVAHECEQRTIR